MGDLAGAWARHVTAHARAQVVIGRAVQTTVPTQVRRRQLSRVRIDHGFLEIRIGASDCWNRIRVFAPGAVIELRIVTPLDSGRMRNTFLMTYFQI